MTIREMVTPIQVDHAVLRALGLKDSSFKIFNQLGNFTDENGTLPVGAIERLVEIELIRNRDLIMDKLAEL